MTEEPRARRATKKPAWLLDNVDPTSAEVEGEPKPRPQPKRILNTDPTHKPPAAVHKQHTSEKQHRPDMPRRMCLNPACKSPFESPQWRRGPLGPGTLCNACGTRYARIEAKKRGEKKGGSRLRPQDLAEWQAFEEQLHHPPDVQQVCRAHTSRLVTQLQKLQQQEELGGGTNDYDDAAEQQYSYDDEFEDVDDEHQQHAVQGQGSSYGHIEGLLQRQRNAKPDDPPDSRKQRSSATAPLAAGPEHSQQQHAADGWQPAAGTASPCPDRQQQQQQSPYHEQHGRVKRRQRRYDEDASDSQEAAACSYPEQDKGPPRAAATGDAGLVTAGDHFLHLLAVGEAMIKTEGVAPEDRQKAWEEYVEKRLPAEQHIQQQARTADSNAGPKRSRFKSDIEERQGVRPEQLPVPPKDRFERLLAEAEQCIRARSASPLLRPITPQYDSTADGNRPQQGGSAPAAAAGDAAAPIGGSSAADKSPLPRTSRLGDAGRQSGAQGLFPPHLELPAAATTVTTVTGSRLCAGGLLDASAAAARYSNVPGTSSRQGEPQQWHAQAPADCPTQGSKRHFQSNAAEAEQGQHQQLQLNTASQQQAVKQLQQQLQQNRQQQLERLAQLGVQQQHNPQAALLSQLCSAGALQTAMQRLLHDPGLCVMLSRCLSDPVATELLRDLLQASFDRMPRVQTGQQGQLQQQQRPGQLQSQLPGLDSQRMSEKPDAATAAVAGVPAQLPVGVVHTTSPRQPTSVAAQTAARRLYHDLAPAGAVPSDLESQPGHASNGPAEAPAAMLNDIAADDSARRSSNGFSTSSSDGPAHHAQTQPESPTVLHQNLTQQADSEAAPGAQQSPQPQPADAAHAVATGQTNGTEPPAVSNRLEAAAIADRQSPGAKRKRSAGMSPRLPLLGGAASAIVVPATVHAGAG